MRDRLAIIAMAVLAGAVFLTMPLFPAVVGVTFCAGIVACSVIPDKKVGAP